MSLRYRAACASAALWIWGLASPVCAEYGELKVLEMFYEDKDLVVTPTRDPKPISQVAENIEVITAKEIQALNAHTLGEVLNTITGMHIEPQVTPGGMSPLVSIQGSETNHVRVIMDGVTINNISDFVADVGDIPAQSIASIEIIKGPGSSVWGSSLGGIINIITKAPNEGRIFGGIASATMGERTTGDFRLELSGSQSSLGYYLFAGGITSDGLRPHSNVDAGNIYGKLTWDPSVETRVQATYNYSRGDRGLGEYSQYTMRQDSDHQRMFATLSLSHALLESLDLNISTRFVDNELQIKVGDFSGLELSRFNYDEPSYGGSAKLAWRTGIHSVSLGADYDNGEVSSTQRGINFNADTGELFTIQTEANGRLERRAVYANDTIVWESFSLTPGLRYDWTNTSGDFLSPSIGLTYSIGEHSVLRAYAARGFNAPFLVATSIGAQGMQANPDLKMEEVLSYQAGFETTAFGLFWLKTNLFRHDVSDFIAFNRNVARYENQGNQRRQGIEVEVKTIPVFNSVLSTGYMFIDARDRKTGKQVKNIPRHTVDVAINYDDRKLLRGGLVGRYTQWNAKANFNSRDSAMLWDLTGGVRIFSNKEMAGEMFFVAHNVFNGSQYLTDLNKNPNRWFEGGIRVNF